MVSFLWSKAYGMNRTMSKHASPGDAATIRLSPVSYLVMGLIGLRGPSTPYELKRAAGRSVNYFWPFPHSQLYGEPERLAAFGLLAQEQEEGGRHRKMYSLTEAGRKALDDWFLSPPGEVFEMRDMAVLQLFFSEFMSREQLVALAADQMRLYRERLAVLEAIAAQNLERQGTRRMAPLDLGLRMARTCLEFWSDMAAHPPEA